MKKILIIGATSAVAQAVAKRFAKRADQLFLIARNEGRLEAFTKDLRFRGASKTDCALLDVNDFDRQGEVIDRAMQVLGGIDIVLIAHGTLPDQKACEENPQLTLQEFHTNAVGTILLLTHLANYLEKQGYGMIVTISSVAGDRGRQSNYVYGAAKAAVTTFMQGLRNRLYQSGVHVLTIKPGFIDTPMTVAFKKGLLWSTPESIARGIVKAIEKKKDERYLPRFWWLIMGMIKIIPESLFKRLSL